MAGVYHFLVYMQTAPEYNTFLVYIQSALLWGSLHSRHQEMLYTSHFLIFPMPKPGGGVYNIYIYIYICIYIWGWGYRVSENCDCTQGLQHPCPCIAPFLNIWKHCVVRVLSFFVFVVIFGPLNPKPQTQDPKPVFASIFSVSESFDCVYGII